MKKTCGCTIAFPERDALLSDSSVKRSTASAVIAAATWPSSPGACQVSASVNTSSVPVATAAPCAQAHGLPSQPGGSSAPSTTRTLASVRANRSSCCRVSSLERSSTAMISRGWYADASSERSSVPMVADSLRAGTITEIGTPPIGGTSVTSGVRRRRRGNDANGSAQGSPANQGIATAGRYLWTVMTLSSLSSESSWRATSSAFASVRGWVVRSVISSDATSASV